MHIFTDCNMVEFVPDKKEQISRIVVTPFFNYAMPLIRYDLGDVGYAKEGACECGRGYPLMEVTFGRNRDHLETVDGKKIYPGFFTRLMDGKEWVRFFQFRQKSIDRIELHIEASKPVSQETLDNFKSAIEPDIQKMMGESVYIAISIVDKIEQSQASKYRYVINEIAKG
jgi:phenylacetate-CoA ligase